MLKKFFAILISLVMIFAVSLQAVAEDGGQPPEPPAGGMAPPGLSLIHI